MKLRHSSNPLGGGSADAKRGRAHAQARLMEDDRYVRRAEHARGGSSNPALPSVSMGTWWGLDLEKIRFEYSDVSDDRRAWLRTKLVRLLEHDLISAGFRPVGCTQALHRTSGQELLDQLWVGEGGRVMACAGAWAAELITLFEDGSIVKTATCASALTPTWRLRRHPADRHEYLALRRARIEAMLARHRERIAPFEARSAIVLGSMHTYLATRLRTGELIVQAVARRHGVGLVCMVLGEVAAFIIVMVITHRRHFPPHGGLALALLAMLIAAPAAFLIGLEGIGPLMTRLRPGPPPRSASVLLEIASALPRGRLKD
jgi:hypothetical protein